MITKRMLGLFLLFFGLAGLLALFVYDILGGGQFAGVGPVQRAATGALILTAVVGLTLVPLGNRPA